MQKDILVLTDRVVGAEQGATLTYRLLLPPSIGYRLHSLMEHHIRVWWAERHAGNLYLRACLSDCTIHIRSTRSRERQFVAVGEMATSSYIYRDTPTCLLTEVDIEEGAGPWQMIQLSPDQGLSLVDYTIHVSPVVLSMRDAIRTNKRALRAYWPTTKVRHISPKKLLRDFKSHATLSELVRISGMDAYETSVVAALVDAGGALSLKEIMRSLYGNVGAPRRTSYHRIGTRLSAPTFVSLFSKAHGISSRRLLGRAVKVDANDVSVEHERIVAALGDRLDSMSLTPSANALVDLAMINGRSALFFEVKTVNNKNLLDQVRLAISQLMEYRFIYKNTFERIALSLVAPALGSQSELMFAKEFVRDCGIYWLAWHPDSCEFECLDDCIAQFLQSTRCG